MNKLATSEEKVTYDLVRRAPDEARRLLVQQGQSERDAEHIVQQMQSRDQ